MFKFTFLFLVTVYLLLVSMLAFASDPWTEADTKREYVYMTLHAADWLQTREIARNPHRWYERNKIMGEHPTTETVDAYFTMTALIHIGIAHALPADWRSAFQYVTIGMEAHSVSYNYRLGIRVGV